MLVSEKLQQFYKDNNLSENGGENDPFFNLTFRYFSIKLPNSDFRKKIVYIHDIQHVLYNKDIKWKGEAFIAGWEIATGLWKHFPINMMSFWAMGFSILLYPKNVLNGYKEGLLVKGIIDLNISKEEILNYNFDALKTKIKKEEPTNFNWLLYCFWVLISQIIFLFPLIFLLVALIIYL